MAGWLRAAAAFFEAAGVCALFDAKPLQKRQRYPGACGWDMILNTHTYVLLGVARQTSPLRCVKALMKGVRYARLKAFYARRY